MAILEVLHIIEMLSMNLLDVLIEFMDLMFDDDITFLQAFIHAIFQVSFLFYQLQRNSLVLFFGELLNVHLDLKFQSFFFFFFIQSSDIEVSHLVQL